MLPTLRLRRSVLLWRLRRRPLLWWTLAALAATLAVVVVQSSLEHAGSERCPATPAAGPDEHADDAGSALARSMPPGARAIAVPVPGLLAVEVGDRVDLIAPGALEVEGAAAQARTVVEAALVVAVRDEAVTLAVPAADAPEVAVAATQGGASLAVVSTA